MKSSSKTLALLSHYFNVLTGTLALILIHCIRVVVVLLPMLVLLWSLVLVLLVTSVVMRVLVGATRFKNRHFR